MCVSPRVCMLGVLATDRKTNGSDEDVGGVGHGEGGRALSKATMLDVGRP